MNAAQAFIAFLRCEANQAEERAKSLRATAATIEANSTDGRGKKKRKRERSKRAPTAYTLFVHENYDMIKKAHGEADMASRDVISLVAQRWAETSEAERQMWQFRAEQHEGKSNVTAGPQAGSAFDEELPSLSTPVEDDGGGKKRARKQPTRGVSAVASASHHSVSV